MENYDTTQTALTSKWIECISWTVLVVILNLMDLESSKNGIWKSNKELWKQYTWNLETLEMEFGNIRSENKT